MKSTKASKKNRPTSVVVSPNTETTDFRGIQELFGIRRALAYHLAATGQIESFSLKEGGESRGKRLFDVASIRKFLSLKRENRQPAVNGKSEIVATSGGDIGRYEREKRRGPTRDPFTN